MESIGIVIVLLLVNILAFLICYSCLGKEGLLIFGVFGSIETFFLISQNPLECGPFLVMPNVCVILLLFGALALMYEKFGKESAFEYVIVIILTSLFAICVEAFGSLIKIDGEKTLFNLTESGILVDTILTYILLSLSLVFFTSIWSCFNKGYSKFIVKIVIGILAVSFFTSLLFVVITKIGTEGTTIVDILKTFVFDWIVQLIVGACVVGICSFFNSQDTLLLELDERGSNDYRIDYKYKELAEQVQIPENEEDVQLVEPVEKEEKVEKKPVTKKTTAKTTTKTTTTKKPTTKKPTTKKTNVAKEQTKTTKKVTK